MQYRRLLIVLLLCLLPVHRAAADGQATRGRISVTVTDQTGAVIRGASVTVEREDTSPADAFAASATSNNVGVAVIDGAPDGRYVVTARFAGFEPAVIPSVRARGRETRVKAVLRIAKLDESVTVRRDAQSSSLDPRGAAFSSVLTREQIDALPDDPDEMEATLKALAPPGAVLRVDGFTGGKLPPKSQIRSIRLPRMDMFAAQNHGGMSGLVFIDIMTMPGNGPLRGNVDFNFLDDAMNARNAFTPEKGDEQVRLWAYGAAGTIRPNRSSFSVNGGVGSQYTSSNILAVLPDGSLVADSARQPRDSYNLSARFDQTFKKDHALRASYDRETAKTRNLGVGGYNLLSRAYRSESSSNIVRLSENGPIRRRMFTETRLQVKWTDTAARSAAEIPTVRVQDAFTTGGAQQRGGQKSTEVEFASDLDYVRGAHSWRTGVLVEGGRYRADDMTNYLGTYTFASLADYSVSRPTTYSRRLGDPTIAYSLWQAGVYLQDDWRIARSLLLSPGLRYGVQGNVSDPWNLSPRMSVAWAPFRNGSLTLRASYGYFYDWIGADLFKQSLLVDGYKLRETNVQFPSYPNPGPDGATSPSNRYLWPGDLVLPNAHRMAIGVERTLSQNGRLNASYNRGWGRSLVRGRNLNAPVGGVRPDPGFANVVELRPDAASSSQSVNVSYSLVRLDLRRLFLMLNYTWSRSEANTAGGYSLPASGDELAAEWGPSMMDVPHRVGASLSLSPFKNVSMGINARAQSGLPYNVTTGRDDNGDGVFTDRPAGVSRNSARGAMQIELGGRLSYALGFGAPRTAPGGGTVIALHGGGGGLAPGFGGGASDKRYRIEFYISGQNLLNRANFTSYSFVMTSPLFGQPVAAANPRKFQVGARFGF